MTDVDIFPLVWSLVFAALSFGQRGDVNCAACIVLSAMWAWLALVVPVIRGGYPLDSEFGA